MASRTCKDWTIVPIVTIALGMGSTVLGCATRQADRARASTSAGAQQLQAEVQRLSLKIATLETQLQQQHRAIARERLVNQEQRERLTELENGTSSVESDAIRVAASSSGAASGTIDPGHVPSQRASTSLAVRMTAEAELRQAYLALMRAIERMDISAEEKAVLKNSLRPTRSLDPQNPWATARHQTPGSN